MINIIQQPENFQTDNNIWWLLYNPVDLVIASGPFQCSGVTWSPLVMVTGDTKEELDQYIIDNNLITENTDYTVL
jgi:hypothetical protein